jgi:GAF domain-containing protein
MTTIPSPRSQELRTSVPFWSQLRWTLLVYFVILAALPVAVVVYIVLTQTTAQAQEQIFRELGAIATLKENEIKRWLADSEAILDLTMANPAQRERFVTLAVGGGGDTAEQNALNEILDGAADSQDLVKELFFYNTKGRILASSNPVQVGKIVTTQPYFASSLAEDFVQPPYYELGQQELTMLSTHPVQDRQSGAVVGVLAGRLDVETLGVIMTERTGLGESGETYLVSPDGNYLLTPSRFEAEGYIQRRAYHSEGIDNALQGRDGQGVYNDYRDPPRPVLGVYRWLPVLQAGMLAELDQTEALRPIRATQNNGILVAAGFVILAVLAGLYLANRIAQPITRLTQVAAQVAAGDLEQKAEVTQQNEIGLLAGVFNQMTAKIQELIASLEEQVVARTQRLEIVASLSERLNAILKLEELLPEVVNQVKSNFGYYHAQIYLFDDKREKLVVAAGTGVAGKEMRAGGHSIPADAPQSLVARAARAAQIVRVDNVRETPDWLPNPLLPHTYAEMAVPIILGEEVVGVLDVQEDEIAGLDEGDAGLLRSLANQVAVAMKNAHFIQETQQALAEVEALNRRLTREVWETIGDKVDTTGYVFSPGGTAPASTAWLPAMTRAVQQKHLTQESNGQSALAIPLTLRGEVIGAIGLERAGGQSWSDDELTTIQTVTEQVSLALDAARLARDTERAAWRDRVVSETTAKVWASAELEEVLRAAVAQLGDKLHASEVVIRLGTEEELTQV